MADQHKTLRLGSVAPDFEAETTLGKIKFHEWLGDSWACLDLLPFVDTGTNPSVGRPFLPPRRFHPCLHD